MPDDLFFTNFEFTLDLPEKERKKTLFSDDVGMLCVQSIYCVAEQPKIIIHRNNNSNSISNINWQV